jgi:predicted dehydrogenase
VRRRQFIQQGIGTAAAASISALSSGRIWGANDRVQVGLIGCGGRGMTVAKRMREVPNVAFVAVCDVYEPHAAAAKEWAGSSSRSYHDFRDLLQQKEIDAVLIATPDHWHAIPTVLACQAGKDVYVEKPLAHNIREGRAMVEAARKHNRIIETGTQQRSAEHYREVARIVQSGELGRVHFVRMWNYMNLFPEGIGRAANSEPPAGLDWDSYLGPAPYVPFNKNRFLNTFRWFWDYAGGLMTDWGTHRLDSMHEVMGVNAPITVSAAGGRYELKDGAETPDILQVTYQYPGFVLSYECSMLNGLGTGGRTPGKKYYRARRQDDRPHGEAFYGTNGTLFSDRIGFEIFPELEPTSARRRANATNRPSSQGQPRLRMQRKERAAQDATDLHVRNFIECVRSRAKPVADGEIGHRSTIAAHLGNIAYRTGRQIRWDSAKEEIIADPQAAALLGRKARKPWDLI